MVTQTYLRLARGFEVRQLSTTLDTGVKTVLLFMERIGSEFGNIWYASPEFGCGPILFLTNQFDMPAFPETMWGFGNRSKNPEKKKQRRSRDVNGSLNSM